MAGPEKPSCSTRDAGTPTDVSRDRPSSSQVAQTLRCAPSRETSAPLVRSGPKTVRFFIQRRRPIGQGWTSGTMTTRRRPIGRGRTSGRRPIGQGWTSEPRTETTSVPEDRSPGGRMQSGTNRRIRDLIMRQGSCASRIRDIRQRSLPTKNRHAGHCSSVARVIRVYQSDSSSKQPDSSFLPGFGLLSQRRNE